MSTGTGTLAGRRAVVTGAAGALGQVIVAQLAAEGAAVAGLDLNADGLAALAPRASAPGGAPDDAGYLAEPVDLTDFDAVQRAVGRVVERWGAVDILVNGAGGGAVSWFHEMTPETWATQLDRNLTSVFNVTRAVLPGMLARRYGRIINIASVAAVAGGRLVRGATAYAAAKAGVVGLTKALAIEVAEQGVTVNCIAPGAQATPGRDRDTPERREALLAQIPTRLLGEPGHLAQTIAFLAGPAAVNITGVVLPLDGGHSI